MSAVREAQLAEIVGVTTARLRQLGSDGEIPAPVKGAYDLVPTLKALFAYYRKRAAGAGTDLKIQRARTEKRKADLLDMEFEEKQKRLVEMSTVQRIIADTWIPVRQTVLAMPTECGRRCNPEDPDTATNALRRWVDTRFFPTVRANLPDIVHRGAAGNSTAAPAPPKPTPKARKHPRRRK